MIKNKEKSKSVVYPGQQGCGQGRKMGEGTVEDLLENCDRILWGPIQKSVEGLCVSYKFLREFLI